MKQREDNQTADMFGNIPDITVYMFYVETVDGECIEWRGLTLTKAKQMYAYTNACNPSNVVRSGWEALK
jgi:hypothetical protein